VRGGHGWEEALLQRGSNASEEIEIMRRKERNGDGVRNVRVDGQIPFLTTTMTTTRGDAMIQWSVPKIMDQRSVLIQW
jgi:hypothetical protein